jgi:hypothetical protein
MYVPLSSGLHVDCFLSETVNVQVLLCMFLFQVAFLLIVFYHFSYIFHLLPSIIRAFRYKISPNVIFKIETVPEENLHFGVMV